MSTASPVSAVGERVVVSSHTAPTDGETIIGLAICTSCRARFRVKRKNENLIGKSIRCMKCHTPFVIAIETPTPVEAAAIKNEEEQKPTGKPRRKKRTKAQMLKHQLKSIKKSLMPLHLRLNAIASQEQSSEEQVRIWCIDVLRQVLGYTDSEIDTEFLALGQRIDIVLKLNGKVFMIIECKNTKSKLGLNVVNQGVNYATSKSADWVVVTNGHIWRLYRVIPVKGKDPLAVRVFDISLLDADGVSEADVANFYMLTKRAITKGETERLFHQVECLSHRSVVTSITSQTVIKSLRRSLILAYKKSSGQRLKLELEDVETRLRELLLPPDLSETPGSSCESDE